MLKKFMYPKIVLFDLPVNLVVHLFFLYAMVWGHCKVLEVTSSWPYWFVLLGVPVALIQLNGEANAHHKLFGRKDLNHDKN